MLLERPLTVEQVAETLQVSERLVLGWLRAGRLRGFKPGGNKAGWRIERESLRQFIQAQTPES